MRTIYPKEWVECHPYDKTDNVDRYYCSLVNKINKVLYKYDILAGDPIVEDEAYEEAAIIIALWFEDIISQTGIWQAFTSQCEKRYGSRLPFYEIDDEDYYPDEINVEDIRFILWHCLQSRSLGVKVYNPENQGIEIVAWEVYKILNKEYETAPENERLQDFLDLTSLTEDDFLEYRNKVDWFYFNSYINIGCSDSYLDSMEEKMREYREYDDLDPRTFDVLLYSHRVNTALSGRTPLLAINAPEYLRIMMIERGEEPSWGPYMDIESREESFYLVDSEEDDYYVFKDITDEGNTYKVTKKSMELNTPKLIPGDTYVTSILFKYGEYWYHNGAMMRYRISEEPEIKEMIDKLKNELSHTNQKNDYKNFISVTNGKRFVFLNGDKELQDFLFEKMKYRTAPGVSMPDMGNGPIMLSASPENGLFILNNLTDCIASPDNPYYNKARAEKHAINFLTESGSIPYTLACSLFDNGFLKDAGLNSVNGPEYGREFARKNGRFMLDYFFNRNREKDLGDSYSC